MIEYVCGLAFTKNKDKQYVLLILKKRGPMVMVGRHNGVGGKIEPDERSDEAMVREFLEETGVYTHADEWVQFAQLEDEGSEQFMVTFFKTYLCWDTLQAAVPGTTDEETKVVELSECFRPDFPIVPNLRWLIPMALEIEKDNVACYRILECN